MNTQEMQEQIDELGNRLAENFINTIDMFSKLVETSERFYESSHCRFVSEKSEQVGAKLGMDPSEQFMLRTAGLFHGIGKIGLPDTLLSKFIPEMTKDEFDIYSQHPELGKQILSQHPDFEEIAEIVSQYRERLDGSGFPKHLRGDEIRRESLIIAVADMYHDVMFRQAKDRFHQTDRNPMRSVSTFIRDSSVRFEQIMYHFQSKSGVLYPKDIVEAFVAIIEEERKQLKDKNIARVPVTELSPGMILAEGYYTSFGLLIVSKGEVISASKIVSMTRFLEQGELPSRVLIIR